MSAPGSRLAVSGSERLLVGAALAVSLGLVWLGTNSAPMVAAFGAGLIGLGG